MRRLLLASSSPRRCELLAQLGVPFEVCPSQIDESVNSTQSPDVIVLDLARRKAQSVASRLQERTGTLILGADTIVVRNGQIFGKPRHETEACNMLQSLSGRTHEVYTGICLVDGSSGREQSVFERTRVHFAVATREEITAYVQSGEPMDKAGAYGIQGRGAIFVEKIKGDYNTVVGLPLRRLYVLLRHFGFDALEPPRRGDRP